jgi:hypothetical protein
MDDSSILPIIVGRKILFEWMRLEAAHTPDHALTAKAPLFTTAGFFVVSIGCFAVWWLLSNRLKHWSLKQDETGAAECTYKMRFHASWGVWAFAFSLTLAAIMWMKALHHEWFSTMYGVQYWAGSVWLTLATVYLITMILDRQQIISEVLHEHQYYFLGSVFFAFTVFYATSRSRSISSSGTRICRKKPSGTCCARRALGSGRRWSSSFGHFFVPFLGLLRIDLKSNFPLHDVHGGVGVGDALQRHVLQHSAGQQAIFAGGFPFGLGLAAAGYSGLDAWLSDGSFPQEVR